MRRPRWDKSLFGWQHQNRWENRWDISIEYDSSELFNNNLDFGIHIGGKTPMEGQESWERETMWGDLHNKVGKPLFSKRIVFLSLINWKYKIREVLIQNVQTASVR